MRSRHLQNDLGKEIKERMKKKEKKTDVNVNSVTSPFLNSLLIFLFTNCYQCNQHPSTHNETSSYSQVQWRIMVWQVKKKSVDILQGEEGIDVGNFNGMTIHILAGKKKDGFYSCNDITGNTMLLFSPRYTVLNACRIRWF